MVNLVEQLAATLKIIHNDPGVGLVHNKNCEGQWHDLWN
jgi:hypothetical protein